MRSKTITIISLKGGYGTTTITANLAVALAQRGRKVCVVDISFEPTDIGELLGIYAEEQVQFTFSDFLFGKCNIGDAINQSALKFNNKPAGEIHVILFSQSLNDMMVARRKGLDFELLRDGLMELEKKLYDYILIDGGHGLTEESMSLMAISDDVIVINTSWNTQSWTNAVVFGDIARKLDVNKLALVVNKIPVRDYTYDHDLSKRIVHAVTPPFSAVALIPEIVDIGEGIGIFAIERPDHPLTKMFFRFAAYFDNSAMSQDQVVFGIEEWASGQLLSANHAVITRKLKVFICHISHDKPVVRDIYRRLAKEGWVDPWLDEEKLLPGDDWNLVIQKALETTDVVLMCISHRSIIKEGYIQKEVRKILDVSNEKPEGTIFLIPFRLDDCDIPSQISHLQCVDYYADGSYGKIIEALNRRFQDVTMKENLFK